MRRNVDLLATHHRDSPSLASSRGWLGLCLLALGDGQQAEALAHAARAAFDAQPCAGTHYRASYALLTEALASKRLSIEKGLGAR